MDLFLKEMELNGLIFEDADLPIRMDGKTRYIRVSGRSRRKTHNRSGWYVGHLGEYPVGKFGWMHGSNPSYSWSLFEYIKNRNGGKLNYVVLTPEEVEKDRLTAERNKKIKLREEKERLQFSMALTILEYYRSQPLRPHPYLHIKRIDVSECSADVRIYNQTPYTRQEIKDILGEHFPEYVTERNISKLLTYQEKEIKYRGFNLMVVGRNFDHQMMMFQLIFDKKSKKTDKNKHFPKGLIKQNTFHTFGPAITPDTEIAIICEGWATGLSLLRFTLGRVTIIVAWDSGNMNTVAKTIRKRTRKCKIYSANDNDHTKTPSENAGLKGGLKTGEAVGAYMVPPEFDSSDAQQEDWSDWNDINLNHPFDVGQQLFIKAFKAAKFIHGGYVEGIEILSENERFSDFDYTELLSSTLDPVEFNKFWLIMTNLICSGIMHCEYSKEEQLELYKNEKILVDKQFQDIDPTFFSRKYDPIIDKKISQVFFDFSYELAYSTKSVLFNDELFISTILTLSELQHYTDTNLLLTLKEHISSQKDEDLAEAIFFMYLQKSGIFRNDEEWKAALTSLLKKEIKNEIQEGLFFSLITQQKSEYHYWAYISRKERELVALNEFLRIYEIKVNNYVYLNNVCMSIHYDKLPYIYRAAKNVALDANEENMAFLQRLIKRLETTDGFILEANSFT